MNPVSDVQITNVSITAESPISSVNTVEGHTRLETAEVIPESPFCKSLRRRIRHLTTVISRLKTKSTTKTKPRPLKASNQTIQSSLKGFITFIDNHDLQFNVKSITNAFLLKAKTVEEVREVLKKTRTLTRTKAKITKPRNRSRLNYYLHRRTNVNRIFRRKQHLLDHTESLAVVFNQNIVKKISETMIFYHLPLHPDLKKFAIKRAHFDGKFTNCPLPYKQSVELRVVLGYKNQEITLTYARALLTGYAIKDYVEFFEVARNHKLKKVPIIVTDFELAVSRAVKDVFNNVQIRGCWYHYWNNILSRSGLLKRVTGQKTRVLVINVLSIMPYLHHKELFLIELIKYLEYDNELKRHRDVNYKLIMYVYSTYMKRFRHLFTIDLHRSLARTNNTCEGSNSALSKFSAQKLNLREFADYVEISFKKQYVKKLKTTKKPSSMDKILLALQDYSEYHVVGLLQLLIPLMDREEFKILDICPNMLKSVHSKENITEDDDKNAKAQLDILSIAYKRTRAQRKRMYKSIKERMLNMTNMTVNIENNDMLNGDDSNEEEEAELSEDESTINCNSTRIQLTTPHNMSNLMHVSMKTTSLVLSEAVSADEQQAEEVFLDQCADDDDSAIYNDSEGEELDNADI